MGNGPSRLLDRLLRHQRGPAAEAPPLTKPDRVVDIGGPWSSDGIRYGRNVVWRTIPRLPLGGRLRVRLELLWDRLRHP